MRERLLIRHFLQRFLDHDLISPHADRREVLTVVGAMVIVSSLFVSVFLAVKYQFNLFLPPGLTALLALDDRFFYLSVSMIVMGLLAVTEWDALALDARDSAVLGPLPVPTGVIVRAKFIAVTLFVVAFDVALCIPATVIRPAALPVKLPVTIPGALTLMAAHAACAIAAGVFGFVAVLGLRETLRAVVGSRGFRRISAPLQALLVVCLAAALLLLPGSYTGAVRFWGTPGPVPAIAIPPLWFVGLHETIAGGVLDGLPRGIPPRRFAAAERQATLLYRSLWPAFHRFAMVAVVALVAVTVVTIAVCAWNSRRLPAPSSPLTRRHLPGRAFAWIATRLIARRPAVQAGFFFTLQSLARSVPHRVTMAGSVAVALALIMISTRGIAGARGMDLSTVPVPLLAVQTLVISVVLTGFRHVVRVPADVRANWTFHLAWSGDERPYLAGVKRAGLLVLALPTLALLTIWHAAVLTPWTALAHAACGACVALLLLDVLFVTYRKLPFACAYVRGEDLKSVAPLYVVAALILAFSLAGAERAALGSAAGSAVFFGVFAVLVAGSHALDGARRRVPPEIDLDELPSLPTQRFELIR